MDAIIKEDTGGRVNLELTVSPEEFEIAKEDNYKEVRREISVPGFRKGRVPRKIAENYYGDILEEDSVAQAVGNGLDESIEELSLTRVDNPEIKDYTIEDDGSVIIEVTIAVLPRLDLDIEDYEVDVPTVQVSEEEVEEELKQQLKEFAPTQPSESDITENSKVNIDYHIYSIDDKVSKLEFKDTSVDIVPYIENLLNFYLPKEELIGLKAGDTVSFEIKNKLPILMPERYISITVNSVEEPISVELDDNFIQQISTYDTVEDYKAFIRAILENEKFEKVARQIGRDILNQKLIRAKETLDPEYAKELDLLVRKNASERNFLLRDIDGIEAETEKDQLLNMVLLDEVLIKYMNTLSNEKAIALNTLETQRTYRDIPKDFLTIDDLTQTVRREVFLNALSNTLGVDYINQKLGSA